ncbi:MAG TPA: SDR family oxidoreductase, partial [Woeseiaceae bacterium]|nr:SDR family oxidoreductase [Woeseiaceae bacterium]
AMALDHAREGVRVNAVCPGDVETPMLYRSGSEHGLDDAAALSACNEESPTGRVTTADEVAALVAYLAGDAARQITGAAIPIDGGNTAG